MRKLLSALREFHTYACDCHEKQELKNLGLLAPVQAIDRADVDLVTFAEFAEIMRQIELRWPGRVLSRHRVIAKIPLMAEHCIPLKLAWMAESLQSSISMQV